jgi:NDP-4-keto-2,6-dideoxyhexose 3-C-methyltransferase
MFDNDRPKLATDAYARPRSTTARKAAGPMSRSTRGNPLNLPFPPSAQQPFGNGSPTAPRRTAAGEALYREITQCRICGNADLASVLDLGEQYLTGIFPSLRSPQVGRGPIELVKCIGDAPKACGLVQLCHNFAPGELYGETYGYRSGLNRSMVEHLHRKSDALQKLVPLGAGDLVLDIGSNDGTLLGRYPADRPMLVGIDPSARKFAGYYRPDIRLIVDFFSADVFRRHFGDRKAKIITSIAMFYDLEQPQAFVDDVARILADDGVWHLEQSYLPSMLQTNAFDTVCHEHTEYYALRQLDWMVRQAGLQIIDVELNATNGGSFAVTVARPQAGIRGNPSAVARMLAAEAALGLETLMPFEQFWQRVLHCREELLAFFERAKRERKTVIGYGASTKGNVVLQFCGITPDMMPCIAEVNEDKFGRFTPGTLIPIVSEQQARAMKPDYFLVLPWHFRDSIIEREAAFRAGGGKLVFPLPTLDIVA